MITKAIALQLSRSATLYHMSVKMSDGKTPARCRVNGNTLTWKTRPNDFKLPVKHGLRDCFYITNENSANWTTFEEEAKGTK